MKNRIIDILIIFLIFCVFINCSINNRKEGKIIKNNITDFYFNEILAGNKYLKFHRDEYKIIEYFGEPFEIRITPASFYFEGGKVVEYHQYFYDDFIHYYYIFEDGTILYKGFIIERKQERLKTINIGDTSDKLLSTFSDRYFLRKEYEQVKENVSYYSDSGECEIQFIIENNIIQKIYIDYLLI